jgi:hypothetical protein
VNLHAGTLKKGFCRPHLKEEKAKIERSVAKSVERGYQSVGKADPAFHTRQSEVDTQKE